MCTTYHVPVWLVVLLFEKYIQFHGSISRGCVAFSKAHCTAALFTITVVHYCSLQSSVLHCSLVHCCVLSVTRKLISFKLSFFALIQNALYIAYHSPLPIFFCICALVYLCISICAFEFMYLCILYKAHCTVQAMYNLYIAFLRPLPLVFDIHDHSH